MVVLRTVIVKHWIKRRRPGVFEEAVEVGSYSLTDKTER